MHVEDLDFRHLALLDALLRRRSVSAAARELDLPQPTASHGLARLRTALDDPLLVRARGGMEPTARALAISEVVAAMLRLRRELEDGGADFAPERLEREFVIAGSDVGQLVVLTSLYEAARAVAPGARFRALTLGGDEMAAALESGQVDLAFGAYPRLVANVKEQTLYSERYYCFAQPKHPFAATGSLEDFLAADHVVVSTRGLAHAHRAVERDLLARVPGERVRVTTGSFMVAIVAAARSGLVLTAPARVIAREAAQFGLVRRDPPFPLQGFEVKQYWHLRSQAEPAHRWLRGTLWDGLRSAVGSFT